MMIGFHTRIRVFVIKTALVCACAFGLGLQPFHAAPLALDHRETTYRIIDQNLRSVLADFGESFDIQIDIDTDVKGRVQQVSGEFTPEGFLHHLALTHGFSWYYDGQVIHVTPVQDDQTVILQMNDISLDDFVLTLTELGIADDRFPVVAAGEQGLARASGPPRYIELLSETFQAISLPTPNAPKASSTLTVIQGNDRQSVPQ
ncbi:hypothetical protein [Parasulfitobacter algicola]|uniref:Uncharacterized protein n=1 Tax=Parasulfitobacter algicola TaxID=2614809 RepID=A0ABX2J0P9_9RHOB|nr:hypothetical protein [Sulfitobacter algicola]NSX56766.1 hypothetical protein [Sulfitobacter algicola]